MLGVRHVVSSMYVSTEARDGWYEFAEHYGVNVTSLVEAMGVRLGQASGPEGKLPVWLRDLVRDARSVASSRSSRANG